MYYVTLFSLAKYYLLFLLSKFIHILYIDLLVSGHTSPECGHNYPQMKKTNKLNSNVVFLKTLFSHKSS